MASFVIEDAEEVIQALNLQYAICNNKLRRVLPQKTLPKFVKHQICSTLFVTTNYDECCYRTRGRSLASINLQYAIRNNKLWLPLPQKTLKKLFKH